MSEVKVYFRCSDCGERTQYPMELDTKRLINNKPKSLKL